MFGEGVKKEILESGPLAGVLDDERQVVTPFLQPDVCRVEAVEQQRVDLARAAVGDAHGVVATAAAEHVGVAAGTAHQRIVARPAVQDVIADTAVQGVVARQSQQGVVPAIAIQRIRTRTSGRKIIACSAKPIPAMPQPHLRHGRRDVRTRRRIIGPGTQQAQAVPSGQLPAREALQVHQVHHRRLGIIGLLRIQPSRHCRVVQHDARVVDRQRNAVEIGLEPGLQRQRPVDRIFQRLIRLIEQCLPCAVETDRQRRPRSRCGQKRLAVEAFEDGELVQPRLIRRAASADSFKAEAEIDSGKRTGGRGGQGAGVAPGLEQAVELSHLATAGGCCGIGGELAGQRLAGWRGEAGGLLQASDLAGALHVGQGLHFGGERDAVGEFAEEGIAGEVDVSQLLRCTQRSAAAVGADEAAEIGDLVAVAQQHGVLGLGDDEGGDAFLGEGEEFTALAEAILIEIGP